MKKKNYLKKICTNTSGDVHLIRLIILRVVQTGWGTEIAWGMLFMIMPIEGGNVTLIPI